MTTHQQRILVAGFISGLLTVGPITASNGALAQILAEDEPTTTETDPNAETAPETEQPDEVESGTDTRFTCEVENGEYTVMYAPASQPGAMYAWATPGDMGSAWPAERRCNEISRRLEAYRPDGLLELQTGRENGYSTVCVTTEAVSDCRIVFTVPTGQDPVVTRDRVFDNLAMADQGQTTQGVTTLVEGDSILDGLTDILGTPSGTTTAAGNINLQPFLDPADGGTGTQLMQRNGRPLNPDNF